MVRSVFILIIFEFLLIYPAYSTNIIGLMATRKNVLVVEPKTRAPLLTINEPVTIVIFSNTSFIDRLICSNEYTPMKDPFNLDTKLYVTKNDNYFYALDNDFVASAAMKGTWKCQLFFSPNENPALNTSIQFEFDVEVRNQGDSYYQTRRTQNTYYFKYPDNINTLESMINKMYYQNTPIDEIIPKNTENKPRMLNYGPVAQQYPVIENYEEKIGTQLYDHTAAPSPKSNPPAGSADDAKEPSSSVSNNSNTLLTVLIVVISVVGIAVGVIAGTVGRKTYCRKNTDAEPAVNHTTGLTADPVYMEMDNPSPNADRARVMTVAIADRAPCPLPPEEREINKKYIHYDTPYDHRFDRPIPRVQRGPNPRQQNAQIWRKL